ncbi:MAG: DASH family cryptochrome [Bacteroidota bacterium]
MKRSIVWFTTDLRLYDNETLFQAIHESDEIIPVYCMDEQHFLTTEYGFKKTGNFRALFLFESLTDLDKSLRELGTGLIVVKGRPEIEIYKLAEKYKAQKVFAKKQVGDEELVIQFKVEIELKKINTTLETFDTITLYHPDDLPFAIPAMPDVFTDFRKRAEKDAKVRNVFSAPSSIASPPIEKLLLPILPELGLENYLFDCRAAFPFKGGESEGINRVNHYLSETHAIASYKETRNGMIGENYSSKFSPWLALGCISPKMIFHEIKKYESLHVANESTYWLIFELLWRDYFVFMMKKYPTHFFTLNGINKRMGLGNKHDADIFEKWKSGQTENDFINANMIELNQTGFMSNRGRQNVASYFCHDLKLDWRYGAAYFEQQLIDYDVSSNWCNWAYIAGVGNNPRGVSIFNVEKQANDYDKNKSFRNLWLTKN